MDAPGSKTLGKKKKIKNPVQNGVTRLRNVSAGGIHTCLSFMELWGARRKVEEELLSYINVLSKKGRYNHSTFRKKKGRNMYSTKRIDKEVYIIIEREKGGQKRLLDDNEAGIRTEMY